MSNPYEKPVPATHADFCDHAVMREYYRRLSQYWEWEANNSLEAFLTASTQAMENGVALQKAQSANGKLLRKLNAKADENLALSRNYSLHLQDLTDKLNRTREELAVQTGKRLKAERKPQHCANCGDDNCHCCTSDMDSNESCSMKNCCKNKKQEPTCDCKQPCNSLAMSCVQTRYDKKNKECKNLTQESTNLRTTAPQERRSLPDSTQACTCQRTISSSTLKRQISIKEALVDKIIQLCSQHGSVVLITEDHNKEGTELFVYKGPHVTDYEPIYQHRIS